MRTPILALVLCSSSLALAEDHAAVALDQSGIEGELKAQALSLKLPAGSKGELGWIFDSRVLTIKLGAAQVFVGLTTDAACSPDALVAKEKGENDWHAVVRKGTDAAIAIVASSMKDKAGKETFLVEACLPRSRAICGAEKLADMATMERVWSLCSTLRDVEQTRAQVDAHLGAYSVVFVDDSSADRSAGRGGSGKKVRATIELGRKGEELVATYAVGLADGKTAPTSVTLSGFMLRGESFSAAPIAVKTAWPYYLPKSFEGRFTAPGVLLLDGKRFERSAKR